MRFTSCVATFMLIAMVGFAGTASAQPPSNPSLLSAIQTLQNMVSSLMGQITTLQGTVDSLAAANQTNVRFTTPVFIQGTSFAVCEVANVSITSKTIHTELFDSRGTTLDEGTSTFGPGQADNTAVSFSPAGAGDFLRCKFTVIGGSRTDIRGSLGVGNSDVAVERLTTPAE